MCKNEKFGVKMTIAEFHINFNNKMNLESLII